MILEQIDDYYGTTTYYGVTMGSLYITMVITIKILLRNGITTYILLALVLQIPSEKVFRPNKRTPNTVWDGAWSRRIDDQYNII